MVQYVILIPIPLDFKWLLSKDRIFPFTESLHLKKIFLRILNHSTYILVNFFHLTYRYRYFSNTIIQELKSKNQNYIFSIWHQDLFSGILAQSGHPHVVIVSQSKDAEPVAFTCLRLGHIVSRGSSKKGTVDKNGKVAKDEMIESLKRGVPGAVTVDGPKGPALKAKPGIIDMAKNSQAVIIPYVIHPKFYWQFNSWDHFRLPKPFSPIFIHYGDPISIDDNLLNYDESLQKLELQMKIAKDQLMEKIVANEQFSQSNWWA